MSIEKIPEEVLAILLAIGIATLRVIYDQEETRPVRVFMEGALCGGLTFAAHGAITALGLDANWTVFAGGMIGFMGSHYCRMFAMRWTAQRMKD